MTTPEALTEAIAELLELHAPPETVSLRVTDDPRQIAPMPVIVPASATGFTVTEAVAVAVPHEPEIVYVMITDPAATPVTIPDVLTVAMLESLLVQTPPEVASVRVMPEPAHTEEAPLIDPAEMVVLTFTRREAAVLPQLFTTV